MTYRVRKQAFTGRLVLQTDDYAGANWRDVAGILTRDDTGRLEVNQPFDIIPVGKLAELNRIIAEQGLRIARYDRRAAASKKAREEKAREEKASEITVEMIEREVRRVVGPATATATARAIAEWIHQRVRKTNPRAFRWSLDEFARAYVTPTILDEFCQQEQQ